MLTIQFPDTVPGETLGNAAQVQRLPGMSQPGAHLAGVKMQITHIDQGQDILDAVRCRRCTGFSGTAPQVNQGPNAHIKAALSGAGKGERLR